MSDLIRIAELRGRREMGVVVVDEPGEGYEDLVPVAKAELDALLDAVEAASHISGLGIGAWPELAAALEPFDFGDAA